MIRIHTLFLHACLVSTLCSLQGMDAPPLPGDSAVARTATAGAATVGTTTVGTTIFEECINIPYLLAKLAALIIEDKDASQENEYAALEQLLLQRKAITIVLDSLKLGTIPLTIHGTSLFFKELCNPQALSHLLHLLNKDYTDPYCQRTFADYLELLTKAIDWPRVKAVLDASVYESLVSFMQQKDAAKFEAQRYRLFFETVARALEFPFDTEVNTEALDAFCDDLAQKRKPLLQAILACFAFDAPQDSIQPPLKRNRYIRAAVGLVHCLSDFTKDRYATCAKLVLLYALVSSTSYRG